MNKNTLKKIISIILAVMLVVSLTACTSSFPSEESSGVDETSSEVASSEAAESSEEASEEVINITVATEAEPAQMTEQRQKTFDKWNEEHPNIQVEWQFMPTEGSWGEQMTKLQTMMASGTAPDTLQIASETFRGYKDLGMLEPISDYLPAEDLTEATKDIADNLQVPYTDDDGTVWVICNNWNDVVMHFNTDRLDEVGLEVPEKGWTKDDFLSYCEKLTDKENNKYAVTMPDGYFNFGGWLYSAGLSYMNEDMTEATIDSPEAIEFCQFMQDLIYVYGYAPVPDSNTDTINQLVTGQVAMGTWGRWPTANYAVADFKNTGIQYMPTFNEAYGTDFKVIMGTGGLGILSSSEHKEETAQICAYAGEFEFVKEFYSTGGIPCNEVFAGEIIPGDYDPINWEIFYQSAFESIEVESPVQFSAISSAWYTFSSKLYANQGTAEELCTEFAAEIERCLAE